MMQKYLNKKKMIDDERYMRLAIESAEASKSQGEQARGAVLVFPNRVLAESQTVLMESSPICHAEMNVIRKAIDIYPRSLKEGVLYVTTEPCTLCLAAICECGIKEVVFGCHDVVNGAISTKTLNLEKFELAIKGGILAESCYQICSPSLRENLKYEIVN